jgi:type IV secretion system protein VirB6
MDIITQLFQQVDSVAASAIQQIYQSLSQGLLPVFTVALTIYVAYWGYEMIYGRAPLTAGAFIWRVVRIAIIYSLAFGWGDFSTIVVATFTQSADGVASAVCTGVGGSNCGTSEASVSSTLSTLLTNAMNAGKTIASSGGYGAAIGLSLLAIVLMIATVIFVAIAILYVLAGKIALFILLGLAPLFIAMALFDFSSALFTGWLRTCAQYSLVPVIVYGILGFLLTLMNQTITNLGTITDVSSAMTYVAPFLILCVVGAAMLPMSLTIAASIAGGHALTGIDYNAVTLGRRMNSAFGATGIPWVAEMIGGFGLRQLGFSRSTQGTSAQGNTVQSGAGASAREDPVAEQVRGALQNTREAYDRETTRRNNEES